MGRLSKLVRSAGYGAGRRARKVTAGLCLAVSCAASPGISAAESITIAALGDSLTQGYGLPQEDGFVPQLQDWLTARGHDVVVINAGVSGDTTAGGLSRVAWTLTPDVDAMIVALGGNDLLRGIAPEVSRANLAGILEVGQQAGLAMMLVGLEAPGNYGPDYKAAFDGMYPDLAGEFGALHVQSFLGALTEVGDRAAALARYMQADGIHPNAEGVERIVEALGPQVEALMIEAQGS